MSYSIRALLCASLALCAGGTLAQSADTVRITAKDINTKVLKEGTHRYVVYITRGPKSPRTDVQFWTRTIERKKIDGKPKILITQDWDFKDTVAHTVSSICDEVSFLPAYHQFWWKQRGTVAVDFEKSTVTVNEKMVSASDTGKQMKAIWQAYESARGNYFLNWHLDLEVFPTLPFKEGRTFIIPFYDPGVPYPLTPTAYTVTGSDKLEGYDQQQIDCWVMTHEEKGNKEKYWISKKSREVLKLEQEINGSIYRYKIKLGFSK